MTPHVSLENFLGSGKTSYVVQGSDFPFAADLNRKQPEIERVRVIGIGGRPCCPDA